MTKEEAIKIIEERDIPYFKEMEDWEIIGLAVAILEMSYTKAAKILKPYYLKKIGI